MPASQATAGPQLQIAVFNHFETSALGLRCQLRGEESSTGCWRRAKMIVKVAWLDWNRFRTHTQSLHETASG
jgi:hypothetical protein